MSVAFLGAQLLVNQRVLNEVRRSPSVPVTSLARKDVMNPEVKVNFPLEERLLYVFDVPEGRVTMF